MIAKNGRLNTDFQIKYFLEGKCHTPDGKYALLCQLREERADTLAAVEAAQLRMQAKAQRAHSRLRSRIVLEDGWPRWVSAVDRLEAQADLAEMEACRLTFERNIRVAQDELVFIDECLAEVQPLRRFGYLPDDAAHQAAQRDEWKLHLIHLARVMVKAQGRIPWDHLETMMAHPDFHAEIEPVLLQVVAEQNLQIAGRNKQLLSQEPTV